MIKGQDYDKHFTLDVSRTGNVIMDVFVGGRSIVATLTGEAAIKLGHDLIAAGEKAIGK